MTEPHVPRVFSIPFGVPFLQCLADALLNGELVAGFRHDGDPLSLASVTIYVPTRRSARELRSVFVGPLGDVDEDAALFDAGGGSALALSPPIGDFERLYALAPLVKRWKERLPAHVAAMFAEPLVVPVTSADALWLARDVAALMDEVETEGSDWRALPGLVERDLAEWWRVTLEFLAIVTEHWPDHLENVRRSNPAFHRNALIEAEARRLHHGAKAGPVIAAGSTGSIPATARLLKTIANLENGAVVLPGLDRNLDERSWSMIGDVEADPAIYGHPQYGLRKLIRAIGIDRREIPELLHGLGSELPTKIRARGEIVSEAMRPAGSTDAWATTRQAAEDALAAGALDGVSLVEAANERDEALAIAIALRRALAEGDKHAALVTGDRALARRVSAELRRFGIIADDSAGVPLAQTTQGTLLHLFADSIFRPGDPVALLSLLKHPLMRCGMADAPLKLAISTLELVALRGGTGRPDIATLDSLFDVRWTRLQENDRKPAWFARLDENRISAARELGKRLTVAVAPLTACRDVVEMPVGEIAALAARSLEAISADERGDIANLYGSDAGEAMIAFLRKITGSGEGPKIDPNEWPEILDALITGEVVKPSQGADTRISIWGVLEARLQSVGTIVLGSLNEGSWPARARADRFMSRFMKTGLGLEPPERRIGLSAHDFTMALGAPKVILTRAARSGEEPAVASRWLQRLLTVAGEKHAEAMRGRGEELLDLKSAIDSVGDVDFASRPSPRPPVEARPKRFSVTEIETLRRDPYAIYARRILRLEPLEPLLADPGAADRGTLFHEIVHQMTAGALEPFAEDALARLDEIAGQAFANAELPPDIHAVWWPRYCMMAPELLDFERKRRADVRAIHAEIRASETEIPGTGATLRGRADRIDLMKDGTAQIIDFKTGSGPSPKQARILVSPQLALEGALLMRGAFAGLGPLEPDDLLYVRLKADGLVIPQSILEERRKRVITAPELSLRAMDKLGELLAFFEITNNGYVSRSLPFRQADMDGDYDHLARVLEWSAGGDDGGGGEE
jgi:ATP-dependent helicase/nuclease subunit B